MKNISNDKVGLRPNFKKQRRHFIRFLFSRYPSHPLRKCWFQKKKMGGDAFPNTERLDEAEYARITQIIRENGKYDFLI